MPKAGELDWSNVYSGNVGEPEHPLSKPVTTGPVLRKGEVPRRPSDQEIRKAVMHNAPKQPTDQEMFGRFEVTQEQADNAQKNWNNTFQDWYTAAKKPVEKQSLQKNQDWARGPVDQNDPSQLTEEEQRIREIQVDPRAGSSDD